MKKAETASSRPALGFPVLAGLGITLLLMAAGSLLVLGGKADPEQIPLLALICLAAGTACASFFAARRAVKSRLVWGLAAGLLLFVCLMALSLIWLGYTTSPIRIAANLLVSLIASCAGGMLGASLKKKKRKGRNYP